MTTYDRPVRRGTREELTGLLRELSDGWRHLGRDDLADEASAGADRLASGDSSVRVGRTRFTVTEVSV